MKFILYLALVFSASSVLSQFDAEVAYFRHLRYNHVSPYINLSGIHPIDQSTAKLTSHYVFKYDHSKRLVEVINHHYHTEKKHPLASIGVYKLKIEYQEGTEIWTFYDPNGKRISNDRDVYKEIYYYDKNQLKSKLKFYDLNDLPMESNWDIAEYQWSSKDPFIIERRFNLKNE
ncbi:MAG: hypothetical protein AAF705_08735 [Bacteroidota bacterium]